MVMDPNDKQKHKPSPKHTLDEVRESLEDMVRNEFEDVAPTAQAQHAEESETASTSDSSTAGAANHSHEPLQSLPRRKPVGIDTQQLLRSLKGLISHELAEAGDATSNTGKTDTDIEAEAVSPPMDAAPTQKTEDAETGKPVTALPDDKDLEGAAPGEVEEVTLDATSEEDVPEVDLSKEFESEAELLELEAMAAALAEETEPPTPLATKVEVTDARPETGEEPEAEPETAEAAPMTAVEQTVAPALQPLSPPLPSLRVVNLPHGSGLMKAFAVYDPVLGGQSDITEPPVTEPPAMADTLGEPALFVSQWLDELSRQPSHSELGLLEDPEKPTPPLSKPATLDAEDEQTIDLPAVTAAPKDIADNVDVTNTDVADRQHKPKAETGQTSKSALATPPWTDLDMLEIPGGESDAAEISEVTSQSGTDGDADTGAQLTLDIPEKVEESAKSVSQFDDRSPVEKEYASARGDASVEPQLGDNDATGEGLHSDKTERAEKEKVPLTLANDGKSTAESASESVPSKQAASSLALEEQKTVNTPSIDFGSDIAGKAEGLKTTGDESDEPRTSLNLEPDVDNVSATKPSQTTTELSLADGPLLGSSSEPASDDSTTIDLDRGTPETSEGLSTPALTESPVLPPAKDKTPLRTGRVDRAQTTGGGILGRRREPSDVASRTTKEKPAPRRDKRPQEIKTDKASPPPKESRMAPAVKEKIPGPSGSAKPTADAKRGATAPPPKAGPTAFRLTDEPAPPPKAGPAVFKLSDEPPPPPKESRMAPAVKEKIPTGVADQKPGGLPASIPKPPTATPKLPSGTPAAKRAAPAAGRGDDIPVLEDAVGPTDQPRTRTAAPLRSKAVEAPKAEHRGVKETPGSRNLAVQVVAKLNTELRKCGERALSPATVDRLQYLLREVLERGSTVVDNSHRKR